VDVGRFHLAVGRALLNARRYDEAHARLSQARQILTARLGPENFDSRIATATTGYALTRAGRLKEADAIFARLLSLPAGQPPDQAQTNLRLGTLRSAQGRHEEAQKVLRDALAVFSKATPINHAVALAALGEAQIETGLAPDAFGTLTRARELFEPLQPAMSPDRADLLVNLARAQIAIGRPEEAVASAGQAAAFWRAFDAANRNTGIALVWYARALQAAGRMPEAAEPLRQADAILRAKGLPAERSLLEQTKRHNVPRLRP
jgi:serine/threonine-protein kinase